MQVHVRRDKLWPCESQAAPWDTVIHSLCTFPSPQNTSITTVKKLFIFMQNTDPALRKQWQKAVSA